MADKKNAKQDNEDKKGALFVPAGVLAGMGFGFAFNNLPAGLFIGLGAGFLAFAVVSIIKK